MSDQGAASSGGGRSHCRTCRRRNPGGCRRDTGRGWDSGYREETHFAFVEYGVGNVGRAFEEADAEEDSEQPMDVERLTGRAFVVMDGDNERDDKPEEYESILGE